MKIMLYDTRRHVLKLQPETLNDLWLLERMIRPGDIIKGRTQRSIKIQRGDREIKTERKTIHVSLRAEKIEFNGQEIRVGGRIIEGAEEVEHGYHTFEIRTNEAVSIEREWKAYELEKIRAAKVSHPKILICVLDDSECTMAMLTERLQFLAEIRGVSGKAFGQEDKAPYFSQIAKFIREKDADFIMVAGPGFAKDGLVKFMKENGPLPGKKISIDSIAHTGETGVHEVLKRGMIEKLYHDSQICSQSMLVEKFFSMLSASKNVAYGLEAVSRANEFGAVDELLVSDALVRENESLLNSVEKKGGKIIIIESHHESGKRFAGFGVAAFLRFRIE